MESYGLYVHTPFCETKCGYCDFFSVPLAGQAVRPLMAALLSELEHRLAALEPSISTIFVGGGTPTVLPDDELATLLQRLAPAATAATCREFTVEANPGTLDDDKIDHLLRAGVDRVSLGAQSFHHRELVTLERLHPPEDIAAGVGMLRRHGIKSINLDLIFGIPGQTADSWSASLARAVDLGVEHLACYGLTYEPGTRLTARRDRGQLAPSEEALEADMYGHAMDFLASQGFEQYEISNFARPGFRCRHNLNYWSNGPYIGVGPSAAGYLHGRRYRNVAGIGAYVAMINQRGHAEVEDERLTGHRLAGETTMLQLRLNEGINRVRFREQTGIDPHEAFSENIPRLAAMGMLNADACSIVLTRSGRLVADAVIAELMLELDRRPAEESSSAALPSV